MSNDKRVKIQKEAIQSWIANNKIGTLVLPTGVGKTFIGSTIISQMLKKKLISKILVVVPTINLILQWKEELDKWYPGVSDIIDFKCIHSAYKLTKHYDLVVIDEIHTTLSVEMRKFYSNTNCDYVLGLTATIPEDEGYKTFLSKVCPIVYHKTLNDEDIKEILSNYEVYNLKIKFDKSDLGKYKLFDNKFNTAKMYLAILKTKHKLYFNNVTIFDIARDFNSIKTQVFIEKIRSLKDYTTNLEMYANLINDLPDIVKYSKEFWSAMTLRKKVCYESKYKIQVAKEIINKYPDRKWILFNKSIKFAEELSKSIPNSLVYHSKLSLVERAEVLDNFSKNPKARLIAVNALDAGLNVPDADSAIVLAGVSTELPSIQRLGRILRKTDDQKTALFINLYTQDSVEESWVRDRTKNIKVKWIETTKQLPYLQVKT